MDMNLPSVMYVLLDIQGSPPIFIGISKRSHDFSKTLNKVSMTFYKLQAHTTYKLLHRLGLII